MKAFFLFPLILFIGTFAAFAQEPAGAAPNNDATRSQREDRPKLMEALGLSPEQAEQIRRLNQERRPRMQESQRRLRESIRNLDSAIYSDTISDADFQTKLQEHQLAQAEVARLRFEGELAMRKVLTPDQLTKFREIRQRFNDAREKFQKDRNMRPRRPFARPQNGPGQRRPVQ